MYTVDELKGSASAGLCSDGTTMEFSSESKIIIADCLQEAAALVGRAVDECEEATNPQGDYVKLLRLFLYEKQQELDEGCFEFKLREYPPLSLVKDTPPIS